MMKQKRIVAAASASLALIALTTFAQEQRGGHQESQKPMGSMSMEMMHKCMGHCRMMSSSMQKLRTTVEQAHKNNDPAQMRAALAEVQKHMSAQDGQMKGCMQMMQGNDRGSMDHGKMDHSKMKMEQETLKNN